MTLDTVLALAAKVGARVTYHAASGTDQVDGHRWDRWYALRNKRDVPDLVIYRHGLTVVCKGAAHA